MHKLKVSLLILLMLVMGSAGAELRIEVTKGVDNAICRSGFSRESAADCSEHVRG